MCYFDANAVEVRESEWIKIGVDTGAGKTAWPQSVTYGKMIPGDNDLTFLENLSRLASDYMSKVATIGKFEPFKRQSANHCCLLEFTTMGGVTVLYGDKGYMFHRGSNVAKKIGAWIQKEMRDSQYYGCTDAYQKMYNNYMKPRGNKTDAMPLSGDSESRCCRPGPNPYDRRIQTQKI